MGADIRHGPQLDLIQQLREIAGASSEADAFSVYWRDGMVGVLHQGGSSNLVILTTACRSRSDKGSGVYRGHPGPGLAVLRPLDIKLRLETATDRSHKLSGVNREVQVGDQEFDAAVYIDTDAPDLVVRQIFAEKTARDAVLTLVRSNAQSCTIDDAKGNILCSWYWNHCKPPDPNQATRVLDAMTTLRDSLPYLLTTGQAAPRSDVAGKAAVAGLVGSLIFGIPGTLAVYFDLAPRYCVVAVGDGVSLACSAGSECCRPLWLGLPAGLLIAAVISRFLRKTIRGRPDSASTLGVAIVFTFVICGELGIVLGRLLS